MRQVCTYRGRCIWHDHNNVCSGYCPHDGERQLLSSRSASARRMAKKRKEADHAGLSAEQE